MIFETGPEMGRETSVKETFDETITIYSDLEEGEINDVNDLGDVSDISSEEEYLLWQRIQILEKFNTALEQKEAKLLSESLAECGNSPLCLSEVTDNEVIIVDSYKKPKTTTKTDSTLKAKGLKRKKKSHHSSKRVASIVVKKPRRKSCVSTDSDSDVDIGISKRRLQEAVRIPSSKSELASGNSAKSSLKDRLFNMINGISAPKFNSNENILSSSSIKIPEKCEEVSKSATKNEINYISDEDPEILRNLALKSQINRNNSTSKKVENVSALKLTNPEKKAVKYESDELDSDPEALRLIALKSAMLRKTIARKKRREGIKKQIKRSRKSISSLFSDDALEKQLELPYLSSDENRHGTDIEAVDMEIDADKSDASIDLNVQGRFELLIPTEDPYYERQMIFSNSTEYQQSLNEGLPCTNDQYSYNECQYYDSNNYIHRPTRPSETVYEPLDIVDEKESLNSVISQKDEDEDEDSLRAKLLNSMANATTTKEPEQKKSTDSLIITLEPSDLESEYEPTENLKKMHLKLAQQTDFQKSLENFLKDARLKSENQCKKQDVKKIPTNSNTPMAVRHLPESVQDEYRLLLRRMAELEKIKLARQKMQNKKNASETNSIPQISKLKLDAISDNNKIKISTAPMTNKERVNYLRLQLDMNSRTDSKFDSQLTLSRQRITSQMKLVEELQNEGNSLQDKTEKLGTQVRILVAALRTSRVALNQNQKTLQVAHRNLVRLRKQHHVLLNRSKNTLVKPIESKPAVTKTTVLADKVNQMKELSRKIIVKKPEKLQPQLEINKFVKKTKPQEILKDLKEKKESIIVKVSNDRIQTTDKVQKDNSSSSTLLSIINNKERKVSVEKLSVGKAVLTDAVLPAKSIEYEASTIVHKNSNLKTAEYKSPLEFLRNDNLSEDSQAIFCPFEVGGSCKDPQCKYFHPTKQND